MKTGRLEEAIENFVVLDVSLHILDEPMDIKLAVVNEYCELARLIKKEITMKTFLYRIWQCTWGILQNLLGSIVFLLHRKKQHYNFHGAVVTVWKSKSSVSLGMFVFITSEPFFAEKFSGEMRMDELSDRLLVHEYGHTIQSLILGPLYLLVIGIPSTLWGFLPNLNRKRREEEISYFEFFTEKWANSLGEKVTGEKSMENLVID